MAKIAIIGAGGFGTSLAVTADQCGHDVTLWSAVPSEIEDIRQHGENKRLLPGIPVNPQINLTTDIQDIAGSEFVIFAVASVYMRSVAKTVAPQVGKDTVLVNVAKGFEDGTLKRLSQVICEEIPNHDFVALSGPSHAEEIARGVPTTIVAASTNIHAAELVQDTLTTNTLRIYVNEDIIGVEIGGALKNIIALCAGVCDGLDLGDNTKAALMTRGITEISRLGTALGAKPETFAGLSGIGDLIVTCTSMHSRNRRAGILIGKGLSAKEAIERVGMTVEGYIATKTGHDLAKTYQVDMPITEELYQVLYKGKNTQKALNDLMGRPTKHESEKIWFDSHSI
ncbi:MULTISPECIES: NAD(P)H-dependent glycerol-3-phosphate dehydrogenase [Clostridiaceae]|uniref:Glycerol-3-phosphate dehydrogenase [NAD(P)+] n=1 Tax=Clostridium facile TaxID=2763035 RepID=A0ABR7IQY6_9CLOT|nr:MULTISPECIES: NAD(P)H-dependent glycerol-3-phosphate dehydrogenase [Clostridiaceae]MBC5787547.1 NAD(P)H-dependent glycerol-3-phosphate dehydrogenase [Clostridium facile]